MNKNQQHKVSAFTIFEVTVVLAIMSVLITIVSASMNRFNEQLKISTDVHEELNQWRSVRSVIWSDFYRADSIQLQSGELAIYTAQNQVSYKVQDEHLYRSNTLEWVDLGIEAESIYEEEKSNARVFHILFPWKGESMDLSYHYQPGIDLKMNDYFDKLN